MYTNGSIYVGLAGNERVTMQLNMSNRHGLIAGAEGTGRVHFRCGGSRVFV